MPIQRTPTFSAARQSQRPAAPRPVAQRQNPSQKNINSGLSRPSLSRAPSRSNTRSNTLNSSGLTQPKLPSRGTGLFAANPSPAGLQRPPTATSAQPTPGLKRQGTQASPYPSAGTHDSREAFMNPRPVPPRPPTRKNSMVGNPPPLMRRQSSRFNEADVLPINPQFRSKTQKVLAGINPLDSYASDVRNAPKHPNQSNNYMGRSLGNLVGTRDPALVRPRVDTLTQNMRPGDKLEAKKTNGRTMNGAVSYSLAGPNLTEDLSVGPFVSGSVKFGQEKSNEMKMQRTPSGHHTGTAKHKREREVSVSGGGGASLGLGLGSAFAPRAGGSVKAGMSFENETKYTMRNGRNPTDVVMNFAKDTRASDRLNPRDWKFNEHKNDHRPFAKAEVYAGVGSTQSAEDKMAFSALGGVYGEAKMHDLRKPLETMGASAGVYGRHYASGYVQNDSAARGTFRGEMSKEKKFYEGGYKDSDKDKTEAAPETSAPASKNGKKVGPEDVSFYGSRLNNPNHHKYPISKADKFWPAGTGKRAEVAMRSLSQENNLPKHTMVSFDAVPKGQQDYTMRGTAQITSKAGHSVAAPFVGHSRTGEHVATFERDLFPLKGEDFKPPRERARLQKRNSSQNAPFSKPISNPTPQPSIPMSEFASEYRRPPMPPNQRQGSQPHIAMASGQRQEMPPMHATPRPMAPPRSMQPYPAPPITQTQRPQANTGLRYPQVPMSHSPESMGGPASVSYPRVPSRPQNVAGGYGAAPMAPGQEPDRILRRKPKRPSLVDRPSGY